MVAEGPGDTAGPLARLESSDRNRRRTVRAIVLAVGVVVAVLVGAALAAIRSGDGGNGFLGNGVLP